MLEIIRVAQTLSAMAWNYMEPSRRVNKVKYRYKIRSA